MIYNKYTNDMKYFVMLISTLLLFNGRAANPIAIETLRIGSPLSAPIPVKVGLYIPSPFRNYVKVINLGAANSVAVGDALTKGAEQAFKSIYKDVVIIDASSSDLIGQDIYAVISPEIVDMFLTPAGFYMAKFEITCKWTIVFPDGKILYMDTITGSGSDNTPYAISRARNFMTLAVEDHYRKLISHMMATKWWDQK